MGSAVTKPLTRRRGGEKTKDAAVNTPNWYVDENVNDNCQPSVQFPRHSPASMNKMSHRINGIQASEPFGSSPEGMSTSTLNEMIVTTPVNTPCRTGGPSPRSMTAIKGLSILDRCFPSSMSCVSAHRATSPQAPLPPGHGLTGSSRDLEQDTPSETSSTSQSCRSPRTDISTEASDRLAEAADNVSSPEINCPAPLTVQATGLSPDQIGNIRKQIYTEGLNPAEREGGVAFFIPVTEDGMQPLTDGATVAERLTKTKKAYLNYEERMILANINRQTQLFKRKQFAVRDIRNVRGAASTTDITDRMKQLDHDDVDFDAYLQKQPHADVDTDAAHPRRAAHDSVNLEAPDAKKRSVYTESDVFLTEDESS